MLLEQRVSQLVHQRLLDVAFTDPTRQAQVVEDVGVLDDLLRELGANRWEVVDEVRWGGTDPAVEAGRDLVVDELRMFCNLNVDGRALFLPLVTEDIPFARLESVRV